MAGFIDLAMSPKETAEMESMAVPAKDYVAPRYPYGLCLSLETEQLKKLGLDEECCVGDVLVGAFIAEVTSVNKRQMADGTADCRIELQIQKIRVADDDTSDGGRTERQKRRYGGDAEAEEAA